MPFLVIISGLILGSFVSCVSYRLGLGEKFVLTRSKCPKCGVNLGFFNLIPVFSWLLQKGKCQKCQAKISWRYPLIEIFLTITFLAVYFVNFNKIDEKFIWLCLIATILMIMIVVDLEHYFIPDLTQILLFLLCLGFVWRFLGLSGVWVGLYSGALFALFGLALYLFFWWTANIEAIGLDDIKILFIIGFVLTLSKFLPFIFLTGIFGIVFGGIWMKVKKDETFPFAPALCLAMFICLNLGEKFDFVKIVSKLLF